MEEMLVTQALDERDLLVKKINDKIQKVSFVDTMKHNQDKVYANQTGKDVYVGQAESAYQQITDLIARYQRIDAAITESNAKTWIETTYGNYTVAAAISLRSRLRGAGTYGDEADFERRLSKKMEEEYQSRIQFMDQKNRQLQTTAEEMRLSILGRENKSREEKPLEVVEAYVRENTTELVDPLGVKQKISEFTDKRDSLLRELDTRIKVSNATTTIRI